MTDQDAVTVAPTIRVQGEPAYGPEYTDALLAAMAADARGGYAVAYEVCE